MPTSLGDIQKGNSSNADIDNYYPIKLLFTNSISILNNHVEDILNYRWASLNFRNP